MSGEHEASLLQRLHHLIHRGSGNQEVPLDVGLGG